MFEEYLITCYLNKFIFAAFEKLPHLRRKLPTPCDIRVKWLTRPHLKNVRPDLTRSARLSNQASYQSDVIMI